MSTHSDDKHYLEPEHRNRAAWRRKARSRGIRAVAVVSTGVGVGAAVDAVGVVEPAIALVAIAAMSLAAMLTGGSRQDGE